MNILQVVIIVFLILEILNVVVLYTKPGMKEGNGIGIFKAFEAVVNRKNDKNHPDPGQYKKGGALRKNRLKNSLL